MRIPQCNPHASFLSHRDKIEEATARALESGWYILGKECECFESEFSDYCKTRRCIGVASGTDAIEIILRALGIASGDKVATVSNTAVATVAAIERAGATPVFADIDESHTMCPDSLEKLLRKVNGIKAIVAVHLFGQCANMRDLVEISARRSIPLVEDCAQAHGASFEGDRAGSMGIGGAFSFYPTKNLGALGDGGAITTNNDELADRISSLRQYGWKPRFICVEPGVNSRLDELQAAILRVKLASLDEDNARRKNIARIYRDGFKSSLGAKNLPAVFPEREHVYHQFVIRVQNRDKLKATLDAEGIGTAIHYPAPIHLQPAYEGRIPLHVPLARTEEFNREILSLPIFPELTPAQAEDVVEKVNIALNAGKHA